MQSTSDRRRIQRIHLDSPIAARLATIRAQVTDISAEGAKLEHELPLPPGRELRFEFSYDGRTVSLPCAVIRSKFIKREGRTFYSSGIRFPESEELSQLHEMIVEMVERDLEARQAHLMKIRK